MEAAFLLIGGASLSAVWPLGLTNSSSRIVGYLSCPLRLISAKEARMSSLAVWLLVRMLVTGAVVVPVLGYAKLEGADHPLVWAYLRAETVTPTWNPGISPAEPMWSRKIELAGVSVTVSARCCVGQGVVAWYSDESKPRTMFTPGDYIYPTELRIALNEHVVYGRASGAAGGIKQVTKIFAYDLDRRRLLQSVEVDPQVLPPVREPASSPPPYPSREPR